MWCDSSKICNFKALDVSAKLSLRYNQNKLRINIERLLKQYAVTYGKPSAHLFFKPKFELQT